MKLDWPNCSNVRDLGGLSVGDQHVTRHGALIRADNLDQLTAVGRVAVEAVGPSLILDVRASWEAAMFVSPFATSAVYLNAPVGVDGQADAHTVLEDYLLIVNHGQDRIVAADRAIADAPPGPVIVHCHAGRDRTGIVVAIILKAAGVSTRDVTEDYAISPLTDPQVMHELMEHIDQTRGGAGRYLLDEGLHPSQLSAISHRLVAENPGSGVIRTAWSPERGGRSRQ